MNDIKLIMLDSVKAYSQSISTRLIDIDTQLLDGDNHIALPDPHGVTLADIGLDNLENFTTDPNVEVSNVNGLVRMSRGETFITGEFVKNMIIKDPVPVSPIGSELTQLIAVLKGESYYHSYHLPRSFREFEIKVTGTDWSTSTRYTDDKDFTNVPVNMVTSYDWRFRDVAIDGTVSIWSTVSTFTVADIYVETPIVTHDSVLNAMEIDATFTTNALSMSAGSDVHTTTKWHLYQGQTLIKSIEDPGSKLSISLVPGEMLPNTPYELHVTHVGEQWGDSGTEVVSFTTVDFYVEVPTITVTN